MINIIIPCYNSSKTLPDTLNSLISQTKKRFIVTIVDDCSTESIDNLIKEYKEKLSIKYIKLDKNVGPGMARQAGIDSNNMCDYIMFLDSDDMLMPQAIEVLSREANLKKPDLLISSFIQQNKYGIDKVVKAENGFTWLHGKVYKSKFLKENNIRFSEGLRLNEDGSFNTKVLGMTDNIYKIPTITVLWIDNKNSLTRKDKNFFIDCIPDFLKGQVYALNFLIEKNKFQKNKNKVALGITYIYNYLQFYLYYKKQIDKETNEILESLFKKEEIKNAFITDNAFLEIIAEGLADKNTKGLVYFDVQTFSDFLKDFNIKVGENNENSFD